MQTLQPSLMATRIMRSLVLSATLAVSAAQAGLVNVDFNTSVSTTYSGGGVLGAAGDTWNGVVVPNTVMSNIALNDASGAATTAKMSTNLAGFGFATVESNCAFAAALGCDYLVANNRTITFSISGLTVGEQYDLVLYFMPLATGRSTSFRVGSTTKTATQSATNPQPSAFIENQNYVRFTGNVAASGTLAFDLIGGQFSTEGDLNGFQLQVGAPATVPEPSGISLVLAGLAAAALQRRIRRG